MFLGNLPKIDIDIQISSTYSMYLYECCVTFSHYVVLFHTSFIHKLRLQDEVGGPKMSTFCQRLYTMKMSTQGDR